MLFDMNIRQPSHEKIRLRDGAMAIVNGDKVLVMDGFSPMGEIELDENDAIRLGAFLVRWYRERNRAELAAEAARIKASREAKKARYAERKKDKA